MPIGLKEMHCVILHTMSLSFPESCQGRADGSSFYVNETGGPLAQGYTLRGQSPSPSDRLQYPQLLCAFIPPSHTANQKLTEHTSKHTSRSSKLELHISEELSLCSLYF